MKQKYIILTCALCLTFFASIPSRAQITIASDNASNYTTWTNGSSGGTGFTAWDLWTQNTDASHFAGHFLGNSVSQGFGDISVAGQAFGMYGNPFYAAFPPQANAQRFLNNTGSTQVSGRSFLLPGQSFKMNVAVAFRNGYKGFDLLDQNFNLLFNFNVTNDLYTTSTSADLGWTYAQNSVFTLEVQQTDTNTYTVTLTRGSDVYQSGNRTGQFSGVKMYVGNTDPGNDLNNLFFNNMTLQRCAVTTTWDGTTWNNGLPNADKQVIFSGNYTSTGSLSACSVSVIGTAQVTISSGDIFTIENNINVAGTAALVFENNATLLQTNAAAINIGNIHYKRNSTPIRQYEYTYWSSPVSGQTLVGFSPNTNPNRYHTFDTAANNWVNEAPTNVMNAGKGYAIRVPDNFTATPQVFSGEFIGTPNNGNVTTGVVQYNPSILNYNLIGNPYPSAISVTSLIDNTTLGALYFWTHNSAINNNVFTNNDYAVRTRNTGTAAVTGGAIPGPYIAAGQGFFASSSATGNITFTNTMRVSGNNTQFFKSQQAAQNPPQFYYYHINATNTGGAFKQIAIGYEEGATNGYDFIQDAFATDGTPLKFYSLIGTTGFAIQGRAFPWTLNDQISLGYISTIADDYTFTLSDFDTFFAGVDIFVEDLSNGSFHNLKTSSYTFSTLAGTFDNRFKVHYEDLTLSRNEFEQANDAVIVLTHSNDIEIRTSLSSLANIEVFDVLGRTVYEHKGTGETTYTLLKNNTSNQPMILKITLANGQTVTRKLVF